jgi:hypothetical protein
VTTETFHLTIVILAIFIVFMQAAVLCSILFGLLRLARTARDKTSELTGTILPVLQSSRELLQSVNSFITRVEPRLDAAATDLAEMTRVARGQAVRLESTANDIQQRVHLQAVRLDGMATSVLDSVDFASRKVSDAVRGPARRISGAVAAVSAFVESLGRPASRKVATPGPAVPQDKDVVL